MGPRFVRLYHPGLTTCSPAASLVQQLHLCHHQRVTEYAARNNGGVAAGGVAVSRDASPGVAGLGFAFRGVTAGGIYTSGITVRGITTNGVATSFCISIRLAKSIVDAFNSARNGFPNQNCIKSKEHCHAEAWGLSNMRTTSYARSPQ